MRRRTRLYRVEETITVVGVAWVEASTKAEVQRMIDNGEVEFIYNDGTDIRRGDGIKIFLGAVGEPEAGALPRRPRTPRLSSGTAT